MSDPFDLATAATVEPVKFTSGDLVQWRQTDLESFASAAYSLTYVFRPAGGGDDITVTGTVVSTEFHITLASSITATMKAGRWHWQSYLVRVSDSERINLSVGKVDVLPDLTTVADDTRSHASRMLDQIEALIEGRGTTDVESYTIGGRQINKMSAAELTAWRTYYRNEVDAENDDDRRRNGLPSRNTIRARFV